MSARSAVPVRLRGATKVYQSGARPFVALHPLDLDIGPGELTLLIGPSGSGKSTLLSILGCLLQPTSGAVLIGDVDAARLGEAGRARLRCGRIGFVFQSYNLFPNLTAAENVRVALDLKGTPRALQAALSYELLDRVGGAAFADSYPARLSGGQCQRVAIARALAGTPDIILADEPTAALDWGSGREVLQLLQGLARVDRRTVLIVTHDARALPFADRVIRMEDGRLVEDMPGAAASAPLLHGAESRP
jgi:putative ABC transport system ATP-binding protein